MKEPFFFISQLSQLSFLIEDEIYQFPSKNRRTVFSHFINMAMNNDGNIAIVECPSCNIDRPHCKGNFRSTPDTCPVCGDKVKIKRWYSKNDTGVILLLDKVYEDQHLCLHCNDYLTDKIIPKNEGYCPNCDSWELLDIPGRYWSSKDCEWEFNYAISHHIQVLDYNSYINYGKKVEIQKFK